MSDEGGTVEYDRRWCFVHFYAWDTPFRTEATPGHFVNGMPVCSECSQLGKRTQKERAMSGEGETVQPSLKATKYKVDALRTEVSVWLHSVGVGIYSADDHANDFVDNLLEYAGIEVTDF